MTSRKGAKIPSRDASPRLVPGLEPNSIPFVFFASFVVSLLIEWREGNHDNDEKHEKRGPTDGHGLTRIQDAAGDNHQGRPENEWASTLDPVDDQVVPNSFLVSSFSRTVSGSGPAEAI